MPPKPHRGHGEGSLQERNGKIRAEIMIDGKRYSHTTATRTAARAWLRTTRTNADKGNLPPDAGAMTVAEHLDHWLEIATPALKPKTVMHYTYVIRAHLKPLLGHHKLSGLRPDHIHTLTAATLKTNAPQTVNGVLNVLHTALDDAVTWGLLARNVTEGTTRPKVIKKEMSVWTTDQARRFLDSIIGDRREALFRLALSTGMRQGELLGLRWEDVDLNEGRIRVRRTVQRLVGQGIVVGEPKTSRSRTIALTGGVIASLRDWRVQQLRERVVCGETWKEGGYIFTSRVGTPTEAHEIRLDFATKSVAASLPRIRFHDLRHTCATILLSQGVHPKVVQEMLGHSQISMTMDTYSHVLPNMQTDAARVLDRVLSATEKPAITPVLRPAPPPDQTPAAT